jgi:predicted CopG family antitoxin
MSSTTISLERSAYELLKSRKRPDESFSEELRRLLGQPSPELGGFLEVIGKDDGDALASAIEKLRARDLATQRRGLGRVVKGHGRRG